MEAVGELGADQASIATSDEAPNPRTLWRRIRHAIRGYTALDWAVEIGSSSKLPDILVQFTDNVQAVLLHVNHVYTLGFAQRLRRQLHHRSGVHTPIIIETHDVQSRILQERGDLNPWTSKADSFKRLIKAETALLHKSDVLVHCSVDDMKFFEARIHDKPHVLAMPTIDEAFISEVGVSGSQSVDKIDLLFVGADHVANLVAIDWFLGQVWPLIADRQYSLKIVGAIDSLVGQVLPETYSVFRSCFVGRVADLVPFYRAARCVIAPMRSGCGISIKTIEALAVGKPFVGTSKAFRGMRMELIEMAGLRAYDDAQAFADAINHALLNGSSAAELSRVAYDSQFSNYANFASRDEAVRIATSPRNQPRTAFFASARGIDKPGRRAGG
jgi:glycosyltransferase involved in cell wall biosynthesis